MLWSFKLLMNWFFMVVFEFGVLIDLLIEHFFI
jgi:hypothetical protein